jgi:hypothetical protein
MALVNTPAQYDPTTLLLKQRKLWVKEGIMKEITAKYVTDQAALAAARVTFLATLTGAPLTAALAADAAAAAALAAKEAKSWQS